MNIGKPGNETLNHYFGVCDGHGANGHFVSGFLQSHLPNTLKQKFQSQEEPLAPHELLFKTYSTVSDALLATRSFDIMLSGSTAVSCFMEGNKIYVANVGDSRAIVIKQKGQGSIFNTRALSRDQKADDPIEKARILAAGGRVEPFRGKRQWDIL